jgi:tetratricopeptide (TPR) repeat protein
MYEVAVRKIVMDNSRLNPYSTIQKSLTRKNIANDIYQHEWCKPPKEDSDDPSCDAAMTRAIRLYNKAAKEMETLLQGNYFNQVEEDHPQRIQSQQLLLDSLNNIVAVYMKQNEYYKAKKAAVEVLKQDPKNLKGILRAAKSALLDPASTMEEVKAALEAAESEITYKNPNEEKELKRLKTLFKKKQQEYKQKTKEMFGDKLKTNTLGVDVTTTTTDDDNKSTTAEKVESEGAGDSMTKDIPIIADDKESSTEESKSDKGFWKTQAFTIFVQIVVPIALFLLYQLITKANRIAQETMATQDDYMVTDAEVGEPEPEDILDLDL